MGRCLALASTVVSVVVSGAISVVASACAVEDKHPAAGDVSDTTPDSPVDPRLNVTLLLVDRTGASVVRNTFMAADDVYFSMRAADPDRPVVVEDYVFQVVSLDASLLSSDDHACRRFRVNAGGTIDGVHPASLATGAPCTHDVARTDTHALAVHAMPFAIGGDRFVLKVGTAARCPADDSFEDAMSVVFEISPPQDDGGDAPEMPNPDDEQQPPSPPSDEPDDGLPPDDQMPGDDGGDDGSGSGSGGSGGSGGGSGSGGSGGSGSGSGSGSGGGGGKGDDKDKGKGDKGKDNGKP